MIRFIPVVGLMIVSSIAIMTSPARSQTRCTGSACVNLVFDGDSISAGWGSTGGQGLQAQVAAGMGGNLEVHNVAVGGRPVFKCLELYPQLVAPLYNSATTRNVIVFHAGDNDINARRDAKQTYAALTAYVAAAHRQGWKVVVSTELRRPDFPPAKEQELEDYNKLLIQNAAGADAVVDLDRDTTLSDFAYRADPSFFSKDRIHPSNGGYGRIAALLTPAVRRVADRPGQGRSGP